MINYIKFDSCSWPIFNLSERLKFIETRQIFIGLEPELLSHYQLTNKHSPKVKFSISYVERNELICYFEIKQIDK